MKGKEEIQIKNGKKDVHAQQECDKGNKIYM